MNVCVYELGSAARVNTSRRSATTATIKFFFFFYKRALRIFKCNIHGCVCVCVCMYVCVCVSESGRAVVASGGGDLNHRHAPAFIMMR